LENGKNGVQLIRKASLSVCDVALVVVNVIFVVVNVVVVVIERE
jgi:hypothetical protein